MSNDADWNGLLDPDERIIWRGQPIGNVRFAFPNPFGPVFVILAVGYPLFVFMTDPDKGGFFSGAILIGIALHYFVGQHIWVAYQRRRTSYALTNTRALICRMQGTQPSYSSFPITPGTALKLEGSTPGTVWFWYAPDLTILGQKRYSPQGFELIKNARAVYDLLRTIQRGEG